jgi:hypothetical protein
MGKNIDKRVWGVLGKQKTYFSPQKQVEGKTKTPLNANAFDSWDAKRSVFRRVDGYENAVQQGGVVPQATAVPATSPTPTPSITPTITQTQTQTNTPTPSITQTQTPSITPSSTPYPLPLNPTVWYDASDSSTLTLISSGGTNYVSRWNSKGSSTWTLSGVSTDTMPILSASTLMPGNPNIVRFTSNTTAASRDYLQSFNNTAIGHTGSTIFQVWAKPSGYTYATSLAFTRVYSGLTNGGIAVNAVGSSLDSQSINVNASANIVNIQAYDQNNYSFSYTIPQYSATNLNDKFIYQVRIPGTANQFSTFEINQSAGTNTTAFTGTTTTPRINSFTLGLSNVSTGGTVTTNNMNVELAEVMYFDTVLTNTQIEQVELYLKDKWRYDEWASPVPTPTPTSSTTPTPTPSLTPTQTLTQTPSPSAPSFSPSSLSPDIWVDFSDASTITTRTSGSQSFITRITNKGTDTSLTAFTQSTAANQPLVALSTVFTGTSISAATCSNDFLTGIANTPNSNSWTVAAVLGVNNSSHLATSIYGMSNGSFQKNTYWDRTSNSSRIAYFNNGASTFYRVDITNPVVSTWSGQSYIEFVSTTGASQLDYYFTNTSAMTENVVAGSNYTQNTPGASTLTLFNSDGSTSDIEVGEMIFLTRELTTTERTNLLEYFRTKWGLTY